VEIVADVAVPEHGVDDEDDERDDADLLEGIFCVLSHVPCTVFVGVWSSLPA